MRKVLAALDNEIYTLFDKIGRELPDPSSELLPRLRGSVLTLPNWAAVTGVHSSVTSCVAKPTLKTTPRNMTSSKNVSVIQPNQPWPLASRTVSMQSNWCPTEWILTTYWNSWRTMSTWMFQPVLLLQLQQPTTGVVPQLQFRSGYNSSESLSRVDSHAACSFVR